MASNRLFGAHVSSSGGYLTAILNAQQLGANTIQIHPSPPQRWTTKPFAEGVEEEFNRARDKNELKAVFFHGIYLINLASIDLSFQAKSRESLIAYLDLAKRMDVEGVIFHVGSAKDWEHPEDSYSQIAGIINRVMNSSPVGPQLLLEVSAGGGAVIGAKVEHLAGIYELVEAKERVAFALDTQHMWASGYDLVGDLEGVIGEVERHLSLDKVKAIHLNDSMTALASRKDRHANLGEGLIGEAALRRVINHPKLSSIPFILETPALKSMDTAKGEVDRLRSWIVG